MGHTFKCIINQLAQNKKNTLHKKRDFINLINEYLLKKTQIAWAGDRAIDLTIHTNVNINNAIRPRSESAVNINFIQVVFIFISSGDD